MKNKLTGIILAAGAGSRLRELTLHKPKPLVKIANKSLLSYTVKFMSSLNVSNIFVVGGYKFEELQAELELCKPKNIDTILLKNPNFRKGNLYSLEVALNQVDNSFLLMNCDHVYRQDIAAKVKAGMKGITAYCDFDRKLAEDDMKVLHVDHLIQRISKKLTDYNAGYVGMTFCQGEQLAEYKKCFQELLNSGEENLVVENVLQSLAEKKLVRLGDISGSKWYEVDTREDLLKAEGGIRTDLF